MPRGHPTIPIPPRPRQPVRGWSLSLPWAQPGMWGLGMGTSPVAGDPVWGSFGPGGGLGHCHTAWGDTAMEECPCLLQRCRRGPGKQPGQWGGQLWGAGPQRELAAAGLGAVPCCAMPAPPGSASRSRGHRARGRGVTRQARPALGSPLPRLLRLAAAVPGCNRSSGRCGCLCREPGEAAWKKAPCWEPASRCQEKQPPFGGAFQAADEINMARCRALCLPGRPPLLSPEWGN